MSRWRREALDTALANAEQHARTRTWCSVRSGTDLRSVTVRDDGPAFDAASGPPGFGISEILGRQLAAAGEPVRYALIDDEPRYRQAGGGEVGIASFGTRHALSYSSWRRHQWPVSLRPSGARSSHWYMPHTPSSPRSYAE